MEKTARILYTFSYSHVHTGSPKALAELMLNLDRNKFVPLLLLKEEGELAQFIRSKGVEVFIKKYRMLSKWNILIFLLDVIRFIYYLKKWQIDLSHSNEIGWRDSYVLAAKISKKPIVLHLHNPYATSAIKGNFNLLLANKIIVVSESMKAIFKNHPSLYRKIVCIHNGVDLTRFKKSQSSDQNSLIDKDKFVVGFVGQIRNIKGLKYLIETAPGILRLFPDTVFWIVGQDGSGEEGLTEEMKRLTFQLGVEKSFRFFGKRDDIPSFMNRFDLLVVPSLTEQFGKVIIEAMACEKCVIASNVGGIPEIVRDGENGILVPPGDCKKLEQSILSIMRNDELRMRLAESGYKTARDQFVIEKVVEKTEELYMELIS